MPRIMIARLIGLLPLLSGCALTRQIEANIIFEKRLLVQDEKQRHRIEEESVELLKMVSSKHPHKVFTHEFRDGFEDGYRDFLIYGGPIRPPASAPPRFRTAKYLSAEGHCRVRDWFLGFQYGAECADSTGRRQFFTLPILVTDQPPLPPLDIVVLPSPPEGLSTDCDKFEAEKRRQRLEKEKLMPPEPMSPAAPLAPGATPLTPPMGEPKPVEAPMPKAVDPVPATPMPLPPAPTDRVPPAKLEPKYDPLPKLDPPKTEAIPVPSPPATIPIIPTSLSPPAIPLVPPSPSSRGIPSPPTIIQASGTK